MKNQEQQTILLVEDDAVTMMVEKHLLKRFGYDVVAATSGEEAVQVAKSNDKIALVLMDINLGSGMDGPEAARQILGQRNLPVIFLSSHTGKEFVERVRGITSYGYVIKNTGDFVLQSSIEIAFNLFKAQEALWESQRRFTQLAEQSGTIAWEVDAQGRYTYVSQVSEAVLGYCPDELIGRMHFYDLRHESSREEFKTAAFAVFALKEPFHNLVNIAETKTGRQVWLSTNGMPLLNADGTLRAYRGADTDITERKRMEEEKAKLESELQQAYKMETMGQLAGGVAHDFNNMLQAIIGNAELALQNTVPGSPVYDSLEVIWDCSRRSADLTRQLLAFARKQVIAPKVLDLNETMAGMIKMLQRLIGENINLIWRPAADLWPVKVDPSQIDQIMANLCINARDAIADIGTITIETGNIAFDAEYFADRVGFAPGEYVRIAVSDNGSGMDKDMLSHLFEPFFTTKCMGKGTGLGLATVYGAVKQNNGFINVYSEPGQGTTITIYVPRHKEQAVQKQRAEEAVPAVRGHKTILLVEDDPAILKITSLMLERQGYAVLAVSTPGEAIRMARERAGEINLLMTDVIMPEMNGWDLAQKLISLYPNMKRLFMSGYTANVITQHGVLDEGLNFLQKPFSMNDLAAKVRKALMGA